MVQEHKRPFSLLVPTRDPAAPQPPPHEAWFTSKGATSPQPANSGTTQELSGSLRWTQPGQCMTPQWVHWTQPKYTLTYTEPVCGSFTVSMTWASPLLDHVAPTLYHVYYHDTTCKGSLTEHNWPWTLGSHFYRVRNWRLTCPRDKSYWTTQHKDLSYIQVARAWSNPVTL